ncbi:MAG: hypothetical protein JJ926_17030 [Roseitalea sp.]|uniref:hypothetical protein n=1 Tax=Oceaniradius stylonematis TaxID=2184161 RepID=UPI0013149239|nr:hypothetical protein [Oceaniradius stylonematis]MBO6554598.1 hypothetical protein [Roseitalea sp.]MBO6953641.1 hypothetical protein [Rhizobiaceae bacterium]MBO6593930.1 hypothetical protein [Roseitalea sp.]MBO6601385.1 hypothetical protein [Roseitalea sp.]MBO6612881.1 hypothetical protein [Roseitalea sp.]
MKTAIRTTVDDLVGALRKAVLARADERATRLADEASTNGRAPAKNEDKRS